MIDSVALIAPISPPLTGASSIAPPFRPRCAASRSVATGEMLLMSITIAPCCSAESTPSSPVSTSSTSGVSGSIVMTTDARRARHRPAIGRGRGPGADELVDRAAAAVVDDQAGARP